MFATPSKLPKRSGTPKPHLIVTRSGSSSDEDPAENRPPPVPLTQDSDDDDLISSSSDRGTRIPRFNFGATTSETSAETQSLVVSAFHKVLSVLRQNQPEESAEPFVSTLTSQSKQIVPLLEELTYFLEQYHFSPLILSQNIKLPLSEMKGSRRLEDDFSGSDDGQLSTDSRSPGPAYDYDTLCAIMAEAHSFGFSLKMGLSNTAWLSALTSINGAVLSWLSNLYRIPSHLTAAFVDDLPQTRQNILLSALRTHFPTHSSLGYRAFGSSTPVVICTHFVDWVSVLISDIGLPQSSILVGPNAINELKSDEVAVAVIWVLPDPTDPITWSEAQTDALLAFVERAGVWLHAEGHDTILMSSLPDSKSNIVAQIADSLVVDASELLQVERFPAPVIFYRSIPRSPSYPSSTIQATDSSPTEPKTIEERSTAITAPSQASPPLESAPLLIQSKILHLELWFAAQLKGSKFLSSLVSVSDSLCDQLYRLIGKSPSFRILESTHKSNTMLHIRYENPNRKPAASANETSTSTLPAPLTWPSKEFKHEEEDDDQVTKYLYEFIKNTSPTPMPLELTRLTSTDGRLYLVWNPLRCYQLHHLNKGHVNSLGELLVRQASIITSTIACRQAFVDEASKHSSLILTHTNPTNHVGLGALRFQPDFVSSVEANSGKQAQGWSTIIDDMNSNVLNELMQIHHLYYPALTTDGSKCIGLHIDNSEMTTEKVQYHIQLIMETATRIESDSFFLDRIGALVKDGIKDAQEAIQKSKQQRVQNMGVVRALPIVGRVWNWWSPYRANTEGKSYDLLGPAPPKNDH